MSKSHQQTSYLEKQLKQLEQLDQYLFDPKRKKLSNTVQGGGKKKKTTPTGGKIKKSDDILDIQKQSIFPDDWTPKKIEQFVKRFQLPPSTPSPQQKKWTETKQYLKRVDEMKGLKGKTPSGVKQRSPQEMYMLLHPEQYIVPITIKKSRSHSYPMQQLQQQKSMLSSRPLKKQEITQIYQI